MCLLEDKHHWIIRFVRGHYAPAIVYLLTTSKKFSPALEMAGVEFFVACSVFSNRLPVENAHEKSRHKAARFKGAKNYFFMASLAASPALVAASPAAFAASPAAPTAALVDEAAEVAADAADAASMAAPAAADAALEAAEAASTAAGAAIGAGAGTTTGASSFLPQAARAIDATMAAKTSDLFIFDNP